MADVDTIRRAGPLLREAPVSVTLDAPMTRLSARGGAVAAGRLGQAFGPALSLEPLRAVEKDGRAALWLGPDEWLLLAPDTPGLGPQLEAALSGEPGCVVDVSHRNTSLTVTGAGAEAALNAGCPLDLSLRAFPVGACTRTVLAKADMVLWRVSEDRFHVECWRSFAPYVFRFLQQAAQDNAT